MNEHKPQPTASDDSQFQEVLIAASQIETNLLEGLNPNSQAMAVCPNCQNPHLLLEGNWLRRFTKEILNSEVVDQSMGKTIYQSITAVNCSNCRIRFLIVPDRELDEKRTLVELQIKINELERLRDGATAKPCAIH